MTDPIKLDPEGVEKAIATVVSGGAFVPGILSRDDLETALRAYLSHVGEPVQKVHELEDADAAEIVSTLQRLCRELGGEEIPDENYPWRQLKCGELRFVAATIERLTRERDEWEASVTALHKAAELNYERAIKAERERDEALRYAQSFLESFVHEHCDPVPEWSPLPDLLGVLTQIDNATTVARDFKARAEAAESELQHLREGTPNP